MFHLEYCTLITFYCKINIKSNIHLLCILFRKCLTYDFYVISTFLQELDVLDLRIAKFGAILWSIQFYFSMKTV